MFRPQSLKIVNLMSHEETEFQFKQGKAVLIVGRNLDVPTQKGNGAGKSSLNEGIAIAIAGQTIRNAKPRELVRDGCDSGEVELTLNNGFNNCELKIKRKLFASQSKSSVCQIWKNGIEVTSCPDINAYNTWIFTTLGISKEDFFSFFLITKEMYDPFFSVGDVKKKQIINRFSGADIVDKTEPLIKKDVADEQIKIEQQKIEIEKTKAVSAVLSEQIRAEQDSQSDEKIQEKVDGIYLEAERVEKNLELYQKNIESLELEQSAYVTEIDIKETEIKAYPIVAKVKRTTEQVAIERHRVNKEKILLKEAYDNVTGLFKGEIDELLALEKELQDKQQQLQTNKLQLSTQIQDLENKIQGAITCPKCSHEFSTRYADFNVNAGQLDLAKFKLVFEDYKKEIDEVVLDLKNLEILKSEVNQKIIDKRTEINNKITLLDKQLQGLQQEDFEIDRIVNEHIQGRLKLENELKSILLKQKATLQQIQSTNMDVDSLHNQLAKYHEDIKLIKTRDLSRINEWTKQIEDLTKKQVIQQEELDKLIEKKSSIESWLINFKNFKSYLANQSIKNITDYTNLFLGMIRSNITIKVEGYRILSDGRLKEEISTLIFRDGFEEGSYGKFSAGERGRVDLCCILALQELINLTSPSGGLDLLAIDEALDSIGSGLETIVQDLQGLEKTIMIVSQSELNTSSDSVILIEKQNKISKIV